MAKLILTDADSGNSAALTTGLNWDVTGTNGVDNIIVAAGATADLNLLGGEDSVIFAGNASDYTVSVSGTTVSLIYSGGATITIPASTTANTITFADGETASLVIDTGAGTVNLGTQALTGTAASVSGTTSGPAPDLGPIAPPTTNPAFSVTAVDAAEGETATFTITLNQVQATATTVDYAVSLAGGATAADHGDITVDGTVDNAGTGTITFAPGEVSKTITVAIAQDEVSPEDGEGITVTLSNPAGAENIEVDTEAATADITDVPVTFTLTASATSVMEGEQITYTLTASQNLSADTVVSFSVVPDDTGAANQGTNSTNLNDFASGSFNPADKTIVAGTSSVNYTVTAQSDGITELPESYTVKAVIDGVEYTVDTTLLDAPVTEFTLTTGIDDVNGTELDETIIATSTTLTALDDIDGADGEDTLILTDTDGGDLSVLTSATVKNVENLNIQHVIDTTGSLTANVSSWTGLQSVSATQSGANPGTISVTTKGNATSVATKGGTTVAVTDSATTDTLASVSADGNTGDVTVTSDKLTSLSLANSDKNATVTAAIGTRALGVTLDTMAGGVVTDVEATSLAITASGGATTGVTIVAGKATSVSIAADEALTLTALTVAEATSLTVTGDSQVILNGGTFTKLTSIDGSGATGGIDTDAFPILNTVQFIGGAGKDAVQVGATTKTINMAAGDDTVALTAGTTALGSGGSLDGGDGTDTLTFLDVDDAAAVTAATTFEGAIANFEKVDLQGAAAAAVAVNLANLDDISQVMVSANLGDALTLNSLSSGGTVTYSVTQGSTTAVNVTNANTGNAEVANVAITGAAAVDVNTLTVNDVETVNFLTDDSATTPTNIAHIASLTDAAATTINVDGDAGLALTFTGTALTTFDASGVTNGAVSWTSGALAGAATVMGGAGANTFDFSAAVTKAVTYTGGAAVDTITAGSKGSTISTGAGNDDITGGAGVDIINGGDGDDTIASGTGLDQLTGGAGSDTFELAANTSGNVYSTILDLASGDKIDFLGGAAGTFNTTAIALANTAVFQDYIDAATTGNATDDVSWFQFGGNTYLVQDNAAAGVFSTGDVVVEITGAMDLSNSTIDGAATNVLTIV